MVKSTFARLLSRLVHSRLAPSQAARRQLCAVMAIMVEEFVVVLAMLVWGLTTDALLELSGENEHEIATDEVHLAAVAEATPTMTPPPPPARRPRRYTCPGPCCLASYIRFVYEWFEVLCDFMVAIFEHVLDSRFTTERGR
jgi:hypothetical protein